MTASQEAIDIANSHPAANSTEQVDIDFAHEWVEGVKDVTADEVRSLWARVLAAAPFTKAGRISKPTVELLKHFDRSTARMFEDLARYIVTIGFPSARHELPFAPFGVEINIELLKDIGVVTDATVETCKVPYVGTIKQLDPEARMFQLQRTSQLWVLGPRAVELANAVFSRGFSLDDAELADLRIANLMRLANDKFWRLGISPKSEPLDYRYQILRPEEKRSDGLEADLSTIIDADNDLSAAGKKILKHFASLGRLDYTS